MARSAASAPAQATSVAGNRTSTPADAAGRAANARRWRLAPRDVGAILVAAAQKWSDDNAPTLGASIAFYTVFSLSPVILTVLAVAGAVFGDAAVRHAVYGQIAGLVGGLGAEAIEQLIASARQPEQGVIAAIVGPVLFVLGATAVFVQIQAALNAIWRVPAVQGPPPSVEPRALRRYLRWVFTYLRIRLISFALVIGVGFLLLVSLTINAALAAFGDLIAARIGDAAGFAPVLWATNAIVTLAVLTALFAAIFKILPDASIGWIDVWVGAFVTAVLFDLGKLAIGFYLATAHIVSSYGAAGTMIVILIWVFYSAQVFLYGAEVTWLWRAWRRGPEPRASPAS